LPSELPGNQGSVNPGADCKPGRREQRRYAAAMDGLETALIVEVPAAEPAVRRHRLELDANAALGIPAHVTILAPFMPRGAIGAAEQERLARVFSSVPAFDFCLDRTGWFGTAVLWLGPEDPAPFSTLTAAVFAEFPDFPPFEGQFAEVVPHLTVGIGCPADEMRRAEQQIIPALPVFGRTAAATLVGELAPAGRWETLASFPLG
jgi:2'-5' RNA ligase superfamily